mmetsp:Transcript_104408/g.207354  ORF Transcript_104408/g.207354 Transcript_104408/m.207354 type:complete len:575 (-) Transcript_104408:286-2010(-)
MNRSPRSGNRRRTFALQHNEVDFMVLQYTCRDSSVITTLSTSCQQSNWKIAVGGGSYVIDLKLIVDTRLMGKPSVGVVCNGKNIFPPSGSDKAKLKEDLKWQCPFRGTIVGIGERNRFEYKPEHGGGDLWYPATVLAQREDGLFKVAACIPAGEGVKEVEFPAIKQEFLREADGQKQQVCTPLRSLVLQVPMADPKNSTLSVDESTLMTHFFARPSPAPSKELGSSSLSGLLTPTRTLFRASRDGSQVTCELGHSQLSHFLSGQVNQIAQDISRERRNWRIQIGPFASHEIELERKYKSNKAVSLTVDGELLVESTAEDLESPDGLWQCNFHFYGEKFLDWEVFETSPSGSKLNTQAVVSEKRRYKHDCVVTCPVDPQTDFSDATLVIDGIEYLELPQTLRASEDIGLVLDVEALQGSYRLSVPIKVNMSPPSMLETALASLGVTGCGGSGRGSFCCGSAAPVQSQGEATVVPSGMEATLQDVLDMDVLFSPLSVNMNDFADDDSTPADLEKKDGHTALDAAAPSAQDAAAPSVEDEGTDQPEKIPVEETKKEEKQPLRQKNRDDNKKKCCIVQ